MVAGAALLTDYILTVAVSVSSGVAQITSAFEGLYPWRVPIAVGLVLFVMMVNLRGVKESGAAFAIPTYFFRGHDVWHGRVWTVSLSLPDVGHGGRSTGNGSQSTLPRR